MSTHYRIPLNFTHEGLEGARNSIRRIDDFIERMHQIDIDLPDSIDSEAKQLEKSFKTFLSDDLNISGALGALFDFIRHINGLCDQNQIGKKSAERIIALMKELDAVLGVMEKDEVKIPAELLKALDERNLARKEKNWALADSLRDKIDAAGFIIEDFPTGSRLKPK